MIFERWLLWTVLIVAPIISCFAQGNYDTGAANTRTSPRRRWFTEGGRTKPHHLGGWVGPCEYSLKTIIKSTTDLRRHR